MTGELGYIKVEWRRYASTVAKLSEARRTRTGREKLEELERQADAQYNKYRAAVLPINAILPRPKLH